MQTFAALVCAALVPAASSMSASAEQVARLAFEQFKQQYGKTYGSAEEEARRFAAFKASMDYVASSGSRTLGITKFSDLTHDEFAGMYHVAAPQRGGVGEPQADFPKWDGTCYACKRFPGNDKLDVADFDWSAKQDVVTSIKDQERCGSCYAFAACADMESAWYLAGHEPVNLSEQELVSCSQKEGNHGCQYGWSWKAYNFAIKNGIASAATYPYTSGSRGQEGTCETSKFRPLAANFTGFFEVAMGGASDEGKMAQMLPQIGPFAIGINDKHMQHYTGGIDDPAGCGTSINDVNHIVTIVGFGEEHGKKYWKIKNSWGKDWGEHGFYRIVRGENRCALATDCFKVVV